MQTNRIIKSIVLGTLILYVASVFGLSSSLALTSNQTYTNSNGVSLTEKEYNFVNEFYGDNFFSTMTQEDYEWISDLNINEADVSIESYLDVPISLHSDTHATANKKLSIAKSCTTICSVIINATWLKNPHVRSYDVIGARFHNVQLVDNSDIIAKVTSSNGTQYFTNTKRTTTGVGSSVKLPEGATNLIVQQKFYTHAGTGTVFGSYQHAIENVSLVTSLSFIIDQGGYGAVFAFYGDANGKYDQMAGVSIDLNS